MGGRVRAGGGVSAAMKGRTEASVRVGQAGPMAGAAGTRALGIPGAGSVAGSVAIQGHRGIGGASAIGSEMGGGDRRRGAAASVLGRGNAVGGGGVLGGGPATADGGGGGGGGRPASGQGYRLFAAPTLQAHTPAQFCVCGNGYTAVVLTVQLDEGVARDVARAQERAELEALAMEEEEVKKAEKSRRRLARKLGEESDGSDGSDEGTQALARRAARRAGKQGGDPGGATGAATAGGRGGAGLMLSINLAEAVRAVQGGGARGGDDAPPGGESGAGRAASTLEREWGRVARLGGDPPVEGGTDQDVGAGVFAPDRTEHYR